MTHSLERLKLIIRQSNHLEFITGRTKSTENKYFQVTIHATMPQFARLALQQGVQQVGGVKDFKEKSNNNGFKRFLLKLYTNLIFFNVAFGHHLHDVAE